MTTVSPENMRQADQVFYSDHSGVGYTCRKSISIRATVEQQ